MILDIALVFTVLLFGYSGMKKGLVRSFLDFFGIIVALVVASWFSGPVAQWLYDVFFRQPFVDNVAASIAGMGAQEAVTAVLADFPEVVLRAMSAVGITPSGILLSVESGTGAMAVSIVDALSPMLVEMLRVLVLLVLFLLLIVVIRAVTGLLTFLNDLPLIGIVNQVAGAAFGVLVTFVVLWLIFAIFRFFVPMMEAGLQGQIRQLMNDSLLGGMLYYSNPVYGLLGG